MCRAVCRVCHNLQATPSASPAAAAAASRGTRPLTPTCGRTARGSSGARCASRRRDSRTASAATLRASTSPAATPASSVRRSSRPDTCSRGTWPSITMANECSRSYVDKTPYCQSYKKSTNPLKSIVNTFHSVIALHKGVSLLILATKCIPSLSSLTVIFWLACQPDFMSCLQCLSWLSLSRHFTPQNRSMPTEVSSRMRES